MYDVCLLVVSTTTGDEFIKQASKAINEKTFLINFSRNNLEKDLAALEIQNQNPLILFIHNATHRLASRVLKDILQNREIACFIVGPDD